MTEPRSDLAPTSPDLIAPLLDLVVAEGLDAGKLAIAIETDGRGHVRIMDKRPVSRYYVAYLRDTFGRA